MNGMHDLGGMDGFGPVEVERDEPVFHAPWEGRVFAMAMLTIGSGFANGDAFRHAVERFPPAEYLARGYYGRWLVAVERLLVRAGVLAPGEVAARLAGTPVAPAAAAPGPTASAPGFLRAVAAPPRFAVGEAVVARMLHPRGHTRLPRYVRGRRGTIMRVHPACVFPDQNAHGRGEDPQYVYAVGFDATGLWGADADPSARVHVDCFERYLEPAAGRAP